MLSATTRSLKRRIVFFFSKRLFFRRNVFAVATLLLTLLLPLTNVAGATALGTVEKSWSETFVAVGANSVALRGILRLANTQVNGSFTVHSCCGYSTNDISFSILNVDFSAFKDYGVVVDSLVFSWNTGTSEEYEMHFDNKWGQVCTGNVCYPDPSHPSSHNKTIELNVREVAPSTFSSLLTKSNMIIGVAAVVGAGLAVSAIVILRETRKRKQ